ncbi:uncharacterized protein P884DRAFT_192266 [Thermothelomyces heterothallicus CBS 202.75]|uniref:uncharacterized protein n=1 Tax=Thermothelomyces heterothallicus CBS 202.75 TaxID=1149848 RepID=UPI00374315DD
MAHTRAQKAAQRALASPASNHQGNRPQGIRPCKASSRKRVIKRAERNRFCLSTPSETPTPQEQPVPAQRRGHKRKHSIEHTLEARLDPDPKQQRTFPTRPTEDVFSEPAIGSSAYKHTDPVAFWVKEGRWPEEEDWPEETSSTDFTIDRRLLSRKRSLSNLSRKRSNSATSTTPSDQKPREEKSTPYRDTRYPLLLQTKGSYMDISELGITDTSKHLIRDLLSGEQPVPKETLFDDDIFIDTCRNLENKNESRIIQDISRLIVPSAESLALRNKNYKCLAESVNEGWNNSIPLTNPRPQPDYSVGFRRDAFTKDQLAKLSPFVGDFIAGDQSLFMATYYIYFPFLTCEVKCGTAGLDIADRQNAHSMTLAVRAIVELFRAVKREDEVNRQILAFSVSHDHTSVRIYGHYPVIAGNDTKYYQHPIHKFDFTALEGKDRWTAYRFTKNVYDVWVPKHFEKICSAIDQLPSELDFDVPPLSKATGLSQGIGDLMSEGGSALEPVQQDSQGVTLGTSCTVPGKRVKQ